MDSTEISNTDSLKSEKIVQSKGNPSPPPETKPFRLHQDSNPWSSKTPEKPVDPPRRDRNRGAEFSLKEVNEKPDPVLAEQKPSSPATKPKRPESSISLPESYEMLDKLFHSLDSSIRLCRMKGSATTFTNVSPKIKCLTDRRFTYNHLAQIKFIIPEAIEIKKILVHDVRTSCMKPELLLTLDVKAVEDSENARLESGSILLRKIFRSRLVDYLKAHPQDDKIREEDLPEPFNALKTANQQSNTATIQESSTITETSQTATLEKQPLNLSHISQSFRSSFSQKAITKVTEQDEIVASGGRGPSCSEMIPKTQCPLQCPLPEIATPTVKKLTPFTTPVKHANSDMIAGNTSVAAPLQSDCTPAKLASATPVLAPPKRCYMTPDNDDVTKSVSELVRRPSRSRSLKFDHTTEKDPELEDDGEEKGLLSFDDDIFDVLPENVIRSNQEKETEARKQMIAGLPKLFDIVYFLFQSTRRSVVTKEELLHKVVSINLDIVDRKEAEEQLRLLQELAPEWIYEKMSSSRDCLLCVNKISSPDVIRARLAEAI